MAVSCDGNDEIKLNIIIGGVNDNETNILTLDGRVTDINAELLNKVEVVENITELRAFPTDGNQLVLMKYRTSIGDNGGGVFIYDSSLSLIDNGGTVIKGWVRQYTSLIAPEWFGFTAPHIYVSPSGNDDVNELGLNPSSPLLTLQKAFDNLKSLEIKDSDDATIEMAAGTYAGGVVMTYKPTAKRITLKGPARDSTTQQTPTAIIDGVATGRTSHGVYFGNNMYLKIVDIKVQNITGSSTESGLVVEDGSNVETHNFHAENCHYAGINLNGNSTIRVYSGFVSDSQIGIRVYSECHYSIGLGGLTDGRVRVENFSQAGIWIMGSSGHIDYTDIRNVTHVSASAIYLIYSARAHIVDCVVSTTQTAYNAIFADFGSTYNYAGEITFGGNWENYYYLSNGSYAYEDAGAMRYDTLGEKLTPNCDIAPYANNTFDLGTATHSWKDIHSNNYYAGSYQGLTQLVSLGSATALRFISGIMVEVI